MATATLWDHNYLGGNAERVAWAYNNVSKVTLIYHRYKAVSQHIYYRDGRIAVTMNFNQQNDVSVDLPVSNTGEEWFFSGGGKGGEVSFVVTYNNDTASDFTVSDITADQTSTVTFSNPNGLSGLTHAVSWICGSSHIDLETTYDGQLTLDCNRMNEFAALHPAENSTTITVQCVTKKGTEILGTVAKNFTLYLFNGGTSPVIPSNWFSLSDQYNNKNLANYTKANISTTVTSQYGNITGYSITGTNISKYVTVSPASSVSISEIIPIPSAGTNQIILSIYDQRGNTATAISDSFNVSSYSLPTCQANIYRVNSNGEPDGTGTYLSSDIVVNYIKQLDG